MVFASATQLTLNVEGFVIHTNDDLHETILVVEDEPEVQRVVCITLEMQGYRVLSALTSEEALRIVEDSSIQIDLLLSDVVMPLTSGPQLFRKLLEKMPGLRVLFISGYTDDVLAIHGVSSSDVHFLQKPFTSASLGRKVRQILRERS